MRDLLFPLPVGSLETGDVAVPLGRGPERPLWFRSVLSLRCSDICGAPDPLRSRGVLSAAILVLLPERRRRLVGYPQPSHFSPNGAHA